MKKGFNTESAEKGKHRKEKAPPTRSEPLPRETEWINF